MFFFFWREGERDRERTNECLEERGVEFLFFFFSVVDADCALSSGGRLRGGEAERKKKKECLVISLSRSLSWSSFRRVP